MIEVEFNPKKVIKDLEALSDDLKVKAVRAGLNKVAKPLKTRMEFLAPSKTGRLKRSFNIRKLRPREVGRLGLTLERSLRDDQYSVIVGPNKKVDRFYMNWIANFLEHGTKRHEIELRGESNLSAIGLRHEAQALKTETGEYAAKIKDHPGIRPRLFMKRAWESSGRDTSRLFYQGLQAYLNRRKKRSKG